MTKKDHHRNDNEDDEYNDWTMRAISDLEMLAAAYPEEVTLITHFNMETEGDLYSCFPLKFQLTLPDPMMMSEKDGRNPNPHSNSNPNSQSFIEMEFPKGYPIKQGLQIQSFRCTNNNNTLHLNIKQSIEEAIQAGKIVAQECLENEEEAGFATCQMILSTYTDSIQSRYTKIQQEKLEQEAQEKLLEERNWLEDGEDIVWRTSSNCIVDRKSIFQAHITVVNSSDMVRRAMNKLIHGSSKIQRATHNMYAYRFKQPTQQRNSNTKWIIIHDNNDDGEDGAGSKLAHLLEMRDDDGILVVVSRWYGGIHLGPKRFAHIVNAAREFLMELETFGQLGQMKQELLSTSL